MNLTKLMLAAAALTIMCGSGAMAEVTCTTTDRDECVMQKLAGKEDQAEQAVQSMVKAVQNEITKLKADDNDSDRNVRFAKIQNAIQFIKTKSLAAGESIEAEFSEAVAAIKAFLKSGNPAQEQNLYSGGN